MLLIIIAPSSSNRLLDAVCMGGTTNGTGPVYNTYDI